MTKSNLIKYLSATGIGVALTLLSPNTNAQQLSDKEKTDLQRGVQAGVLLESNSNYSLYGFKFDKGLEKSVKNSKSPKISLSGKYPKGTFVKFNEDTSGIKLQVPKNTNYTNPIGIVLRNGINVNICDEKGNVGNKNTPISSFYFDPHQLYLEKPETSDDSLLDLILYDTRYIHDDVNKIKKRVEGIERKVAGIDSTTKDNSKKLDSLLAYNKEDERDCSGNKKLNITASGVVGGPRVFDTQFQYNVVDDCFSFGPFISLNLGKTKTDVKEEIRFREKVLQGSDTFKERIDVYQTETSTDYLGSFGLRATKNISGGFYGFVEAGWNVVKDKIKEFGTAYIDYTRDGVKIKPTNSVPISGSTPDKNVYKFLPMASLGFGENLTDHISLEGKINHEFVKDGKTSGFLGVRLGF